MSEDRAHRSGERRAGLAGSRALLDRRHENRLQSPPRLRRVARRPARASRRAALCASKSKRSSLRSSQRCATGRKCCGAATAAARPKRSTWPPNSPGATCANGRASTAKRSRSTPRRSRASATTTATTTSSRAKCEAFAQPGDVVIGMTTSGTSRNIVLALEMAQKKRRAHRRVYRKRRRRGDGFRRSRLIGPDGYAAIVQEVHQVMAHIVCDLVEQRLIFEDQHRVSATLLTSDARALVDRMRGRSILVVGDLMIDEWIWGTVSRISPEAPVPVVAVTDHSFTLGGAGQRREQSASPWCARRLRRNGR